ncbi:hypothetical protein KIPB_014773, partial [Kipferlia bialata]
ACEEAGRQPLPSVSKKIRTAAEEEKLFTSLVLPVECTAEDAACLVPFLVRYGQLKTLCAWRCPIGDDGMRALAGWLVADTELVSLELMDCGLGALGVSALGTVLGQNCRLESVSLDHTPGVGKALADIAIGLSANQTLKVSVELYGRV